MKNLLITVFTIFSFQIFSQEIKTYKIGDFAQGGIIFWLDESGQHGLVCAKEDYPEFVPWDTHLKTGAEGTRAVATEKADEYGNNYWCSRLWGWTGLCGSSLQ